MRSAVVIVVVMALILGMALADVYMHAPRGSNNRLNENTATRTNANRLFDSQNNNRGGCNAGECTKNTATDGDLSNYPATNYNIKEATAKQYAETYYEQSKLTFAWTNQHGCGGDPENDPHNVHCHIVIQYMCEGDYLNDPALQVRLYNGQNTGTPNNPDAPTTAKAEATRAANDAAKRGRHENELYYAECAARGRNTGLFIADQNVGDNAINTRQNPNGNRSGLECAEERDYYPYWGPTPWKDVVYMTSEKNVVNVDACKMVREQSQNTAKKAKCVPTAANRVDKDADAKKAIKEITKDGCEAAGGVWQADFTWGLKAPECVEAAWTRDNHLGSTRDGYYQNYTWTVPTFDEIQKGRSAPISGDVVKCVARLRYNITTGDYDNWNTFSESNGAANSPVRNNPTVDIGVGQPLKLALNTAQTGRTFQDRTHVFTVRRRPSGMTQDITNLMVIGKKGNIVQTYPAVEYYWIPEKPEVKVGHYLHIQWTGSASHNNNAPGGDGEAGNGTGNGVDRNNFVLTAGEEYSWAIPLDKAKPDSTLFDQSDCYRPVGATAALETLDKKNCAVTLATSGHFTTTALTDTHSGDFAANNNNSPPSLINGIMLKPKKAGKHPFMSSPNNNFTNRSQKGVVVVKN